MPTHPLDRPLDEALNYATHIRIVCRSSRPNQTICGHTVNMKTADLVVKCPAAVTVREFTRKLRCKGCGVKGWAVIKAQGR